MCRENGHHGQSENGPGALAPGVLASWSRLKAPTMKRLLLLFLFLPLLSHAQSKLQEYWCSLLLNGVTVGFLHQTTWQTDDGLLRSEIEQTMEIRRFGVPFSMTQTDVWIEHGGGELVSASSELDMNGQRQLVEARVAEGGLRVELRRAGEADESFLPLEDKPRGLYAIDREIAATVTGLNGKRELDYPLFCPETMKIEEFRMRVLGPGELEDSLGRTHRGVLVEERSSGLPGVVTTEVYDEQARFLFSRTPVGLALEILRLEGEPRQAADEKTGVPSGGEQNEEFAAVFDVASLTVAVRGLEDLPLETTDAVTVLFRGQGVATLYEAVRRAEEDLGCPTQAGDAPLRIVSTKLDARGAVSELVLRVANRPLAAGRSESGWAESGSADPPRPHATSIPPEVRSYLDGSFHLNLADPRLAELLDRCGVAEDGSFAAAGSEVGTGCGSATRIDPDRVLCLERLVDRYIENKSLAYGFAGLEEILDGREGDCTEHALLLVALLRKAGFPSRLAYGLILTESGFLGHAWVELFAGGHWRWLDPSFPGGRPYGLKVRLGVMDPAQPIWASLSLSLLQVIGSVEAEILETEP
jgi:hypothetical protein